MKILSERVFNKIFNILIRSNFRSDLKLNTLTLESNDLKGTHIYEELMSFYKQLITSNGLPLEEFIGGSVKKEEAALLYHLVIQERPEIVVQVGTFLGFSTMIIAEALNANGCGRVYTIDPEISHRGISNPVDIARMACKERGLSDRVEFIKGWFSTVPYWSGKAILNKVVGPELVQELGDLDFVFIDGDHTMVSAISDFAAIANSLKLNGICIFHDVCSIKSVMRAVTAILSDGAIKRMFDFSFMNGHDGLAIFRKVRGYVEGIIYIKDKITSGPIPDVVLYSKKYGKKAITDENGEIYLPGIIAGKYYIEIDAKGYRPLNNYCISLDPARQFHEIIIELVPIR